jgi:hypothetical protein
MKLTVRGGVAICIEGKRKIKWLIGVWHCVVYCWLSASSHCLDPLIVFLFMVRGAPYFAALPFWFFLPVAPWGIRAGGKAG